MNISNIASSGMFINLWCIICENRSIFKITIKTGNDLIDLRKVIKNEKPNYFANVDADKLILWRTNIASNILRNKETAIKPNLNKKLEDTTDTVGNIFQNIVGNNIQVIVDVSITSEK
ncbi:15591_t:CDS:1 [Funneliformis geosporum]|uniref:289_t:CDS:1 n=1 Tax=Funneliformis geosporum TaxID=1117311 RepID=A0A9W4SU13_9GLOM|nr:15591_t:CDS:1 [Funneliformis geosporum]CAI2180888.1 289_t:CDS:1 [Funneliformis geosporum]